MRLTGTVCVVGMCLVLGRGTARADAPPLPPAPVPVEPVRAPEPPPRRSEHEASVGLRLPLDTYNAANTVPWLDGTSTDIGDLSVIFKYVLWRDEEEGHLISAGLAVTPPTGPGSFAGSNYIKGFHNTGLQP